MVNFVREKYGEESVANIITYGTFGAKMIIRDLARVNDVAFADADRIAKMIPDELNISLNASVEKSKELREEMKSNPVAKKIVEQGKIIEGMMRNTGKHACGIIIGDQPIHNLVPVTLQEGDLTTQYAKGPAEDLGLLKMDFLGLKTLTVISDAEASVRRLPGMEKFDIEKVSLDDPKTYELLNQGKTIGVFQLESTGMQSLCKQIEPVRLRGNHRVGRSLSSGSHAIHSPVHQRKKGLQHHRSAPPAVERSGERNLWSHGLSRAGYGSCSYHRRLYAWRSGHPQASHGQENRIRNGSPERGVR